MKIEVAVCWFVTRTASLHELSQCLYGAMQLRLELWPLKEITEPIHDTIFHAFVCI
jgi:hypothetical protein